MSERTISFQALVDVVAKLRSPDGCPWDRAQTHESLKPYVIEEAYEVVEAIDEQSPKHLCEELGDLLLQVVLHAQLSSEEGLFDIQDAISAILQKMVSRHPHVFGSSSTDSNESPLNTSDPAAWERNKREERQNREGKASILDGVPAAMPALPVATRLTEKASRVGFDWPSLEGVREKLTEELLELAQAIESRDFHQVEHEIGDVLFTMVNLSRFLKVDPEDALRKANRRFEARFRHIERSLAEEGLHPEDVGLEELDRRWNKAKSVLEGN